MLQITVVNLQCLRSVLRAASLTASENGAYLFSASKEEEREQLQALRSKSDIYAGSAEEVRNEDKHATFKVAAALGDHRLGKLYIQLGQIEVGLS